jgi:hypothetical protein
MVHAIMLERVVHSARGCVERLPEFELPCALGRMAELMCNDEAEGVHDAKADYDAHARLAVSLIGAVPPERAPEHDEVGTSIRCEGFTARLVSQACLRGGTLYCTEAIRWLSRRRGQYAGA